MKKTVMNTARRSAAFRGGLMMLALVLAGLAGQAQAADPLRGAKTYNERCADCHGKNGVPNMPGVPNFARNERLMQNDLALIRTISVGKGMMPAFQGVLTEQDILDVIAYLRTLQ
jgi:cytochrome c6